MHRYHKVKRIILFMLFCNLFIKYIVNSFLCSVYYISFNGCIISIK